MKKIFDDLSLEMSKTTTRKYSTSFSLGIRLLHADLRPAIYAIYGFVRFADEIVDSFHGYPQADLLADFRKQTFDAIEQGVSLNPILNSFQWVTNKYQIPHELITQFLHSMAMDLEDIEYTTEKYEEYILGSAEVVGLMCLKIFVRGDEKEYARLKDSAMKLGSAFQKINFLRDLNFDQEVLGRTYFPEIELKSLDFETKERIERDIEADFQAGFEGIKQLPKDARFGVYIAYKYYYNLFLKIKGIEASRIMKERVRIPNAQKYSLLFSSYLRHNFNLI